MKKSGIVAIIMAVLIVCVAVGVGIGAKRTHESTMTGGQTATPTATLTAVPKAEPVATPTDMPTIAPTVMPTATPTEPAIAPTAMPTVVPTAQLTIAPTAKPTPSPTAQPTIAPTAQPTPSPTARPTATPVPEATHRPVAQEESIYEYVKNCGLYGTPTTSSMGYVGNYFLKSEVPDLTDKGIRRDSTWSVYRQLYNDWEGYDCTIILSSFGKETRDQVLELLKVIYPTGYQEVMDLVVLALRQEIWEYRWGYQGETPMAGTMGVRYVDDREVFIILRKDLSFLEIHITDAGVINPIVSQPWPDEVVEYLTREGTGNGTTEFDIWYREEYGL